MLSSIYTTYIYYLYEVKIYLLSRRCCARISNINRGDASPLHSSLTRLPWCRDHAELLQHAQRVEVEPAFHELAVHDAVNTHSRDRHRLACRWNAQSGICIGSMYNRAQMIWSVGEESLLPIARKSLDVQPSPWETLSSLYVSYLFSELIALSLRDPRDDRPGERQAR